MRIDGFVPASSTTNNGAEVLSKLKPGDTIRAQVIENSGNELTLKLSDGAMISASAKSPVDAQDGEFVNFVFKGTVDGKPALEVASRNVQTQVDDGLENIRNTLTALRLPVTDHNIELAQAMKGQNVEITADSMSKIMDLVSKNVELKPDAAAFLTAANMSNDKNNIEKLQSLLAGRLKISNDIGDLVKLLDDNTNSVSEVKTAEIRDVLGKLVAEIVAKEVIQGGTVPDGKVNTTTSTNIKPSSNNPANASTISNNSAQNTVSIDKNNATIGSNAASVTESKGSASNTNSAVNILTNSSTSSSAVSQNISKLANSLIESAKINTATVNITPNSNTSSSISTSNMSEQLSNLLKDGASLSKADLPLLNTLSSQVESMLSSRALTAPEQSATKLIANEINNLIFKINVEDNTLEKVDSNTKNLKSFEDSVNNLKSIFVKIDQSSDEINPVKLYKDMDNALQALKSSIQQLPMTMREAALNIANNIESNVNFINQLNNYSSYVQIPMSIFSQNTTGELYMLKKGSKARKLDPSNMTVLISLDSNNIGRIDTLLSIDKKNISTNFRLENTDVFKVLKENHKMLYKSLLEKGYRLVDFTYRLMEEPINIVNFEAEAKKEFIKSPNNIDIVI